MIARLKAVVYSVFVYLKTYYTEHRRWKKSKSNVSQVNVFYGHDKIPQRGEKSSGGIVKCLDLSEWYPNHLSGASILYLVSSALPECPELMVKIAKKYGVKLVVNQNGVAIPAYHGENLEKINSPRRFLLQNAEHVVYQSEFCKVSSDKYLTSDVKSFSIHYNPVNTNVFCEEQVVEQNEVPVLLIAGSHERFLRVTSAVDVLATLKQRGFNCKLMIIGRLAWGNSEDKCRDELIAYCQDRQLEEHIEIGDPYTQDQAPVLFRKADILLHTKYFDPCPRVVVEALSCGLPVVYSQSGGLPELVGQSAGIGVPVPVDWDQLHYPDAGEMADAVLMIQEDYASYSNNARMRAQKYFHIESWLQEHRKIFDQLVKV